MDKPSATAMIQASEGATTGSAVAPQRKRLRDMPPLIKEADLAPKHRLLVEYMVHGPDKPMIAGRITRPVPIIDPETDLPIGTEERPVPRGQPLTLLEAAELLGMRRRTARILSQQPAFQRLLQRETVAFREGAKARAWRKVDELAHTQGDGSAAWAKVNHQAANTIIGEPKQTGPTINVQTNVGVNVRAGLVIRLPADAPRIPLEQQGDENE